MSATVRGISVEGREGTLNQQGQREYTVVYKVYTDNRADGPGIAGTAFGIPELGDPYTAGNESDFAAVVTGKTVSQGDSPYEWTVNVTYQTRPDSGDDPGGFKFITDNPLLEPPELTYGFQNRRILIPGQYNDPLGPPTDHAWEAGIYAPNGELFDPQPEAEISEPVITIKKNIPYADVNTLLAIANCVNADPYLDCSERQLKISAPTGVRKFNKNIGFYLEASYQIAYRWETWDIQLLNQGTFFWSGGKPTSVWSSTVLPQFKALPTGLLRTVNLLTNGDVNTGTTPTFTRIRFYREIQFSALNLL